ncbi:hypothetical protein [Parvularcula sp. LCG005]|uniref:hypothetical protein n=1 Tax=Parvularcula sp. LCG005 TaxID=3078805 RepID=UPI0029420E30|nr:hypothetical protein [Parvularcula sp. LCG005]WOI53023.1 hypothetical protein RUI03_12790 [Parvularcula sp. LCG005]
MQMKVRRLIFMIFLVIAASFLGLDLLKKSRTVRIEGNYFIIPKRHLLLPGGLLGEVFGVETFHFYLPTYLDGSEKHLVSVYIADRTCKPSTPPTTNQLETACAATSSYASDIPGKYPNGLQERHPENAATRWVYEDSDGIVVASCFAMGDAKAEGMCSSIWRYKNLIYEVGFRDGQQKKLFEMHALTQKLLDDWSCNSCKGG